MSERTMSGWRVERRESVFGGGFMLLGPRMGVDVLTVPDAQAEPALQRIAAVLNEHERLRARVEELEAWKAQVEQIVLAHLPAGGKG